MNNGFQLLGKVLRLPVYIVGVALWTIHIFPFVLGFTLAVTVGHALLVPIAYPLAYVLAAFSGERQPPRWQSYWEGYPMSYIRWLRIGYAGLYRWLCHGFSD